MIWTCIVYMENFNLHTREILKMLVSRLLSYGDFHVYTSGKRNAEVLILDTTKLRVFLMQCILCISVHGNGCNSLVLLGYARYIYNFSVLL